MSNDAKPHTSVEAHGHLPGCIACKEVDAALAAAEQKVKELEAQRQGNFEAYNREAALAVIREEALEESAGHDATQSYKEGHLAGSAYGVGAERARIREGLEKERIGIEHPDAWTYDYRRGYNDAIADAP